MKIVAQKAYIGNVKTGFQKLSRLKNKTYCSHFNRSKVKFNRSDFRVLEITHLQSNELRSKLSSFCMQTWCTPRSIQLRSIFSRICMRQYCCTTSIDQTCDRTSLVFVWDFVTLVRSIELRSSLWSKSSKLQFQHFLESHFTLTQLIKPKPTTLQLKSHVLTLNLPTY